MSPPIDDILDSLSDACLSSSVRHLEPAYKPALNLISNTPRPHPSTGEYWSPPLGGDGIHHNPFPPSLTSSRCPLQHLHLRLIFLANHAGEGPVGQACRGEPLKGQIDSFDIISCVGYKPARLMVQMKTSTWRLSRGLCLVDNDAITPGFFGSIQGLVGFPQ